MRMRLTLQGMNPKSYIGDGSLQIWCLNGKPIARPRRKTPLCTRQAAPKAHPRTSLEISSSGHASGSSFDATPQMAQAIKPSARRSRGAERRHPVDWEGGGSRGTNRNRSRRRSLAAQPGNVRRSRLQELSSRHPPVGPRRDLDPDGQWRRPIGRSGPREHADTSAGAAPHRRVDHRDRATSPPRCRIRQYRVRFSRWRQTRGRGRAERPAQFAFENNRPVHRRHTKTTTGHGWQGPRSRRRTSLANQFAMQFKSLA